MKKIFKSNQKGVVHILVILILLLGLGVGLYLIQHPQIFKPRAAVNAPSAQFVDASGNHISQTTTASVKLKIIKNSGGSSGTSGAAADVSAPPPNSSTTWRAPAVQPGRTYTFEELRGMGAPEGWLNSIGIGSGDSVVASPNFQNDMQNWMNGHTPPPPAASDPCLNFTPQVLPAGANPLSRLYGQQNPNASGYAPGSTAPAAMVNVLKTQHCFVTGLGMLNGFYQVFTFDRGTIYVPHSQANPSVGSWALDDISNYLTMHPHGE